MKFSGQLLCGFIICLTGCHAGQVVKESSNRSALPPNDEHSQNVASTDMKQIKETAPVSQVLVGKVVETMDAAGYTYILIEDKGNKNWVAVPAAPVVVGQDIRVKPGMEMAQFPSRSLNRTFDRIIFSAGVVAESNPKTPAGHPDNSSSQMPEGHPKTPGAQMPAGHPNIESGSHAKGKATGMAAMSGSGGDIKGEKLTGKVVETMDSGGYTYISLEKGGQPIWVAVPVMKVAVGQELELQPGTPMTNFTSKSLNRTFDKVIFSDGAVSK